MSQTFQFWWETVNATLGLSNLSYENQRAVEEIAKRAWEESAKVHEMEIKKLQDNIDLLEQTLEEEMSGDFELAMEC